MDCPVKKLGWLPSKLNSSLGRHLRPHLTTEASCMSAPSASGLFSSMDALSVEKRRQEYLIKSKGTNLNVKGFPAFEHGRGAPWTDNRKGHVWVKEAPEKQASKKVTATNHLSCDAQMSVQEIYSESHLQSLCAAGLLSEVMDVLDKRETPASKRFYMQVIRKCGKTKALSAAKRIHIHLAERGMELDSYIGSGIVDMYVKCGSLADALQLHDSLPHRNEFSWTALVSWHANCGQGREAIRMYEKMQEEGVTPSTHTFVHALKACSSLGDWMTGKKIHARIVECANESDMFVGNTLICMYAKCGSMVDARHVFDNLPHRDVVSWTAMISGYAEEQGGEAALQLYACMRKECVAPDDRNFVGALKACTSLAALEEGMEVDGRFVKVACLEKGRSIHGEVVKGSFESDTYMGATLMDMYVKCGSIVDAWHVFDMLAHRHVVAWNVLILACAQMEEGEMALQLYVQMLQESVVPVDRTFVAVLNACCSLTTLEEGREVDGQFVKAGCLGKGRSFHSQVVKGGLESQLFVGSALVCLYAKCGSMVDAHDVFLKLTHRDVVSWNAMILGYAQKEEGWLALELYAQMQLEGVGPDDRTFVAALKASSSLAAEEVEAKVDGNFVKPRCLEKGRSIHSHVVQGGFEENVFVGNTLIEMYAKCGSMVDARHVFDMWPHRDLVSWNIMILGYAEREEIEAALQSYAWMQLEGVVPDGRTFVGALKAVGSLATVEEGTEVDGRFVKIQCLGKGKAIHSQLVKNGFESNVFVGNTLIDMYAKCGSMVDAQHVFDRLPHCDLITWNVMILGYAEKQAGEVALELYARMHEGGVLPDDRTFVGLLKACSSLATVEGATQVDGKFLTVRCLEKVRAIHSQVEKSGFESNVFVGNKLIDMYAKCGSIMDARHVFDRLPQRDMLSWNGMILGYAEQGDREEALEVYAQMQAQGLSADSSTFICILKACGSAPALETGKEIHAQMSRAGFDADTDTILATALIDMYGKCGSMVDARLVFDALRTKDVVTWNSLISGYARQGEREFVFHLFEKMIEDGIQPSGLTFLSVLTLCDHAGLVSAGQKYFDAMSEDYGITPTADHYTCMVDLLGRAGQIGEALALVGNMPFQPDLVTWTTVLGACRKWNNVKVGRDAFDCAVRIDGKQSAPYVLMSSIYADAHMWVERDTIQTMREKSRAWKQPGQSWWTETDGMVHSFVAQDIEHPQNKYIYAKLKQLSIQMEQKESDVPDLACAMGHS